MRASKIFSTGRTKKQKLINLQATQEHMIEVQESLRAAVRDQARQLEEQKKLIGELSDRLARQERGDPDLVRRLFAHAHDDYEGLKILNERLSSCPVIWGDPSRLDISPDASVHSCFFNTNSGRITVGPYTFAGSRVSILAGSHDPALTGFVRRDADFQQGCDITIGSGVWLCSGCTLLGPCTVGDNAVIAAGAVVTPGTVVPPGTVWGGVPARCVKTLDLSEETENRALLAALERTGGVLFVSGWSQKLGGHYPFPVYKMTEREAVIYTTLKKADLFWSVIGEEPVRVVITAAGSERVFVLDRPGGDVPLAWPAEAGPFSVVRITRKTGGSDLYLALRPHREGAASEVK